MVFNDGRNIFFFLKATYLISLIIDTHPHTPSSHTSPRLLTPSLPKEFQISDFLTSCGAGKPPHKRKRQWDFVI